MNNKEFLFIYDAALSNPNGDPDRDNEPRMDKATETNLVSDSRLKRYIRDYLIDLDYPVFVSMVGGQKVSPDTRLNIVTEQLDNDPEMFNALVEKDSELNNYIKKLQPLSPFEEMTPHEIFLSREKDVKSNLKDKKQKAEEEKILKNFKNTIHNLVLVALVRQQFIDIRYFGGAFAIGNYSKTITGPVQINLGYSLHPVKLRTNSISTIMGSKEGQSDIGKKELLYYSLIAFTGTINSKRAEFTKLSEEDLLLFRKAAIQSITHSTTDSKKNQFPKLYLEIEYNDEETYGRLGDLRHYIDVKPKVVNEKGEPDFNFVRKFADVEVDFSDLIDKVNAISDKINTIRLWKAIDMEGFDEKQLQNSIEYLNY